MNDPKQTPHINGAESPSAADIMKDPAGAAGQPAAPVLSSPHIQDPQVAKLLNELPGLVGAIDSAIKDTAGQPFAFMLMIFTPGIALHATNAQPQQVQAAAIELVKSWGNGESVLESGPGADPAANEGSTPAAG